MENVNLTGYFLIAMPAMVDPYFSKSVTFICDHNEQGAMGIVINRPIDMTLEALLEQISIDLPPEMANKQLGAAAVHFGGPVQTDRGFVLHQPIGQWQSTIAINGDTALTTSKDVLEATARGEGPDKILVSLGYAGWQAGQLEQELAQNAWLTVQAQGGVIFDMPDGQKHEAAMGLLGVNLASLADVAGHA